MAADVVAALGLDELEIAEGSYDLIYGPDNFGYVYIDIANYRGNLSQNSLRQTWRIASRKKNCNGGFGFRCGRLSGGGTGVPIEAEMVPNFDDMKVYIEFKEYVDWSLYED